MNLFSILKDILKDKSRQLHTEPDFDKEFSPYMIARYLSMRDNLTKYATYVNKYGSVLDKEQVYKYLVDNVPWTGNTFIKYMKKSAK